MTDATKESACAFHVATDMEDDVAAIVNFARALLMMDTDNDEETAVIACLAREIVKRAEAIEERRGKLFHMLHPFCIPAA